MRESCRKGWLPRTEPELGGWGEGVLLASLTSASKLSGRRDCEPEITGEGDFEVGKQGALWKR